MNYFINLFVAFPSFALKVLLVILIVRIGINIYERFRISQGMSSNIESIEKTKVIIKYAAIFTLIIGIISALTSPITTVKYEQKKLEIDTSVIDAEEAAGEASQASRMPVPKQRELFVHDLGKK